MKFRNIFIASLSAVAPASCSDFPEVDAPSKNEMGYVFSDKTEMNNALNGIYKAMLSADTYGDKIYSTYVMNTDVDFKTNSGRTLTGSNWSRYDGNPMGGNIASTGSSSMPPSNSLTSLWKVPNLQTSTRPVKMNMMKTSSG